MERDARSKECPPALKVSKTTVMAVRSPDFLVVAAWSESGTPNRNRLPSGGRGGRSGGRRWRRILPQGQMASVFIIAAIEITPPAIKKCFLQVSNYVGAFARSV